MRTKLYDTENAIERLTICDKIKKQKQKMISVKNKADQKHIVMIII